MKKIIQIIYCIVIATAFAACSGNSEKKDAKPVAEQPALKTMPVQKSRVRSHIQLPGVMAPFQFVQLYPKVNGFVKNVYVDRGSAVRKGQVLITLEAPEIEQEVAAAKLKCAQAEETYNTSIDRYQRLLETSKTPGTISPFELKSALDRMQGDSATVQSGYANYRAQLAMKDYLVVTAPFDGVITERDVHPGALVGPEARATKPMLVLQEIARLRLTVDVPEQYAVQVKDGDTVHFKVNALPGEDFRGVISRSSHSLSSNYRSEAIEIDIDNRNNVYKTGMYAEVILPVNGNANAWVVPKTAVVTTTERKYVILVKDHNAHWCDITEGNQGADSVEVFGELSMDDVIITNASYEVKDGMAVK